MLDSTHNREQLNFVGGVVALGASESSRKEIDGLLRAGVLKSLFQHRSNVDAVLICLQNKFALRIW